MSEASRAIANHWSRRNREKIGREVLSLLGTGGRSPAGRLVLCCNNGKAEGDEGLDVEEEDANSVQHGRPGHQIEDGKQLGEAKSGIIINTRESKKGR